MILVHTECGVWFFHFPPPPINLEVCNTEQREVLPRNDTYSDTCALSIMHVAYLHLWLC